MSDLNKTEDKNSRESKKPSKFLKQDIGVIIIIVIVAIFIFVLLDLINPVSVKFQYDSEINLFVLIGFVFTSIGCLYAVFAKVIADKVFSKTERVFERTETVLNKTQDIQQSITGFFSSFEAALDEKQPHSAPKIISRAERKLILYLGCPVAGLFRNQIFGEQFVQSIINKLTKSPDLEIILICWGRETELNYFKSEKDNFLKNQFILQIQVLFNKIWYKTTEEGEKLERRENSKIFYHNGVYESPFRFIVADDKGDSEAILWALKNPSIEGREEEKNKKPEAAGFTTTTEYMTAVLTGVFNCIKNTKQGNCTEMTPQEFNTRLKEYKEILDNKNK